MRTAALIAASLALGACSSVQYSDHYRAVEANPECATTQPQPGEPVAPWCKPQAEAAWSSDRGGEPVDFSGDDDR